MDSSVQPLRVLSLWQPWATLMAIGAKRWETRSWATKYTGLVAIHASKRNTREIRELAGRGPFAEALGDLAAQLPFGKVVAIGRLFRCHAAEDIGGEMERRLMTNAGNEEPDVIQQLTAYRRELAFGDYAPGRFAWQFVEVQPLRFPIPLRASQGLFHASRDLRTELAEALPQMREALQ